MADVQESVLEESDNDEEDDVGKRPTQKGRRGLVISDDEDE